MFWLNSVRKLEIEPEMVQSVCRLISSLTLTVVNDLTRVNNALVDDLVEVNDTAQVTD